MLIFRLTSSADVDCWYLWMYVRNANVQKDSFVNEAFVKVTSFNNWKKNYIKEVKNWDQVTVLRTCYFFQP